MPSTTESPPSAGSGASGLRPSSGCSAAAEGCIPIQALREELGIELDEPGERVLAVCTGTWHCGVGVIRSGPDKNNRYVVEFDRDGLRGGCRVIGRPQE